MWEKVTDKTVSDDCIIYNNYTWSYYLSFQQSSESICAELFDSCPKPKQKRSDNIRFPGECFLCKHFEGKFADEVS